MRALCCQTQGWRCTSSRRLESAAQRGLDVTDRGPTRWLVLHVERQTDGNTKVPAQVSPLSFFCCCFFVRFWFVGNWPPDHHWQLDSFQLWLLLLQLIRQTALLYRFRNTHCFTQEFTFLFLMCSVCKQTRMLDSRVRHACTPAGKRPIYCTLPNDISEPVASPCVPACVLCDRSGRVSVSARQPSPDANMRDFIQTEWELSLNSQSYKGKHKHSETPCESSPVLSCPVLATQRTLERTDRRTRCHRTHNLLRFSPLVSFSCFSSH